MFHRKVYPESPIKGKDFIKYHKDKIKTVPHECFREYDNGSSTNPDKGKRFHSDAKSRQWSQHCMTNFNPPQHGQICSSSTGNNEHWIKTDADCKYYIFLEYNSLHTHTHTHTHSISTILSIHKISHLNNTEYTVQIAK